MSIPSVSYVVIFVSFFIAAILEVISLPSVISHLRPEWLVLTVLYWLLRHPEKVGIAISVAVGLVMDVMLGTYLGIHALSLSIVSYLVLTLHQRLKMFPIAQQSMVVFFIVGIELMVVNTLKVQLSVGDTGLTYLWHALMSALIWPFVVIFYDRLAFAFR